MRGYFGQTVTLVAQFGPGQTGLATIGYTLRNGDGTTYQARTTTGVTESPTGSGTYKVRLAANVFSAAFDGSVDWDKASGAPFVSEDLQMVAAPPAGSDYTTARAAKLDFLDALISSRLAAAGYTAPDNTTIAAIYAAVDTEVAAILAAVDTEVAAIKAKTDLIPAAGPADAASYTSARAAKLDHLVGDTETIRNAE